MKRSRMREMSMEVTVGAFMFMVLLALGFFTIILSSENVFKETHRFEVVFNEVMGLRAGDNVLVRGVEIGKVKGLELARDGVHVFANLRQPVTLREDYRIEILNSSVLGGRYMQIDQGSDDFPTLSDTAKIVGSPPVNLIDESTKMIDSIKEALEEGGVLENLQDTMAQIKEVTGKLSKGEGTLGKLLYDESVYNDLQEISGSLKDVSRRLADGKGTLGKLLSEDDKLYADLSDAAAALRDVTTQISSGEGTLGKLTKDDEMYEEVKLLLHELRATVDDLRETAPITTFTSIFFGAF
ncbi:MAG: MCE family protein [Verrucomicrobia bacterium]|nr:MCE family protein [Verrucomicrobiota bacterium]